MKVNKEYIENIFKDSIEKNIFIKAIASSPVDKKSEYTKVNLKPVRMICTLSSTQLNYQHFFL